MSATTTILFAFLWTLMGWTLSTFYHVYLGHCDCSSTFATLSSDLLDAVMPYNIVQQLQQQQPLLAKNCPLSSSTTKDNDPAWHPVHVFVGQTLYFQKTLVDVEYPLYHVAGIQNSLGGKAAWYSQCGQDRLVAQISKFRTNGYFLDLAANDAVKFSNTLALERFLSWDGICFEANPDYWFDLARIRTCHVVGAAVGGTTHQRGDAKDKPILFQFKQEYGGIIGPEYDNVNTTVNTNAADTSSIPSRATPMFTVPIRDVLQKFHAPHIIDYMSLDVEGAEYFVMKDFPFDTYKIKILTGERLTDELIALLTRQNYVFIKWLSGWGESLYIHTSFMEELDMTIAYQDKDKYTWRINKKGR